MLGKQALVAGNGESRKKFDINLLKNQFTIIGCNAIHRDHIVDHLVCCDNRMLKEALTNPKIENTLLYTRFKWCSTFGYSTVNPVPDIPYDGDQRPDQPQHWGSGPYAVLLAAHLGFKEISLIGFDLYDNNGFFNNIYKDTENYQGSKTRPVDPSYWVYQIGKIFEHYPKTKFKIINDPDWKIPPEWISFNVFFEKNIDL